MTPLQKKKAAIIERIETAIDGIDGARDVIPGRYITVADLVIQLARSLMESATTKSIDKIFADAVEDLPGTIENLNNIYGENPPLAPWPGNDITLLGNTYNHRQEEHGPPALFHPMTWFQPSFVGPDGEIPEAVPGDGYTLIGEDFLREVSVGQPLAPYYVHELAKAITAVEGPGYELQVTQGHSSYIFLRSFGQAILSEHVPHDLARQDRRDVDRSIAGIAEKHAELIRDQKNKADERAQKRAIFEKTLAAASGPAGQPMVALGLDILGEDTRYPLRIAYTYQEQGSTETCITVTDETDYWYSLKSTARQHRKSVREAAILEERGGYTISRPLAAFLHSRYGADISDVVRMVEGSTHMSCQITDPRTQDKSRMFGLMIRNAELRGRFDLGPGVRWEYTKIIFDEGALPTAIQTTLRERGLSEIIDLTSIPGLAQVSMTGYYPRRRGFTLTMDSVPVPIDKAMEALEERRLKRAA